MKINVMQILGFLKMENYEVEYNGCNDIFISGFCSISNLRHECVTWIKEMDMFEVERIDESINLLVVSNKPYNGTMKLNIISTPTPKAAYFSLLNKFFVKKSAPSIAHNATVLTNEIGNDVSIGYNCFVDKDVIIGAGTVIGNNVVIENKVRIGENCVIGSGTIIGTCGYGYYDDVRGRIKKVPDFGGVQIGDRVEIGANSCIVRGTLDDTIIGNDVKIDNLVHIAHNVIIGNECMIIAQSMIAGSARLEKRVYVAPCAAIMNQTNIGENTLVGMGAVVTKNIEKNKVVAGVPAKILRDKIAEE